MYKSEWDKKDAAGKKKLFERQTQTYKDLNCKYLQKIGFESLTF